MASGDRKRPSPSSSNSRAAKCPSRFVTVPPRKQPSLPWLPRAGYDDELERDSTLLRAAKNYYPEGESEGACSEFPPLMQARSWTRGVPYRDSYNHAKPVDSTGNCYTRSTKTIRTINMPPKRRPPLQLYGPLGPNGELQFPPVQTFAEREKEQLEAIKKEKDKNKLPKGLVLLGDLVSGAYDRRKAAEAEARKRRIEKKRKEKAEAELAAQAALKRHLAKLEFELPRDPDEQKSQMLKATEQEHYRYIHPKDLERIQYYLTTIFGNVLRKFRSDTGPSSMVRTKKKLVASNKSVKNKNADTLLHL
ncbi:jg1052 [Pararge aegeria aegeria]|uniref:Jg1052 protein n=1 Tax=Pararge aegeria aegeria TaxID=348720 RepID=A0A8S4S2C0_9NEOP|nr:jg1052 [Pararge aegeria aegeria]